MKQERKSESINAPSKDHFQFIYTVLGLNTEKLIQIILKNARE